MDAAQIGRMTRRANAVLSVLTLVLVAGCGGSTNDDQPSTGGVGGGSGGAATGGSGGNTGGSPGGGSGGLAGSGAVGGAAGASCALYLDQTGQATTVRLTNQRTEPIFLGGSNDCGPTEPFGIEGPDGKPVKLWPGGCGHTCEGLQSHGNYCSGACMMPPLIRIEPGGTYERKWQGVVFEPASMPDSCYSDPNDLLTSCEQQLPAPAGKYAFSASASAQATCGSGSCVCPAGSPGWCELPGGGQLGSPSLAASADLSLPAANLVELSFQ